MNKNIWFGNFLLSQAIGEYNIQIIIILQSIRFRTNTLVFRQMFVITKGRYIKGIKTEIVFGQFYLSKQSWTVKSFVDIRHNSVLPHPNFQLLSN